MIKQKMPPAEGENHIKRIGNSNPFDNGDRGYNKNEI